MQDDYPTNDEVGLVRLLAYAESIKRDDDDTDALLSLHDAFYPLAWACYDTSIIPDIAADHSHPTDDGLDSYQWAVDVEMTVEMWQRAAAMYRIPLVEGTPIPAGPLDRGWVETLDGPLPVLTLTLGYSHPRVRTRFDVAFAVEVADVR